MVFCFENTKKDIIMTKENEEDYRRIKNCRRKKTLNLIKLEIIVI